ncbi:uncharacterized protein LOC116267394 isoform X2 [Nymphaea colorata]|uniref:uncharacterized protein LOC116267394 isoform X2 n=1 Tax=Nymphaea colorata TaxID=210225 RepID=UPI00129DC42C|nr:uncharacterized protein LOC116267394 isoform X2 [Nymphaea colorata]
MATADVQGRTLEVSVIGWRDISADTHGQQLYAVVGYCNKSCSTRAIKGGRTDSTLSGNFKFQFIESAHEVDIAVWKKKNSWDEDKLIGFRKIDLDDQVLHGCTSKKAWQLHSPPKRGADIKTAGEIYLEINLNCPLVQNVLPPPSAPYDYPISIYGRSSNYPTERPPGC